jgi:kinesin family protein 5
MKQTIHPSSLSLISLPLPPYPVLPIAIPPRTHPTMSAPAPTAGNNIKVVCRFRPMNRMELAANSEECIDIDPSSSTTVRMRRPATSGDQLESDGFTFDRVFSSASRQVEIFDFGVKGIVHDVMMGFNGTLFCYGQTGSGKTFTMMGTDIEDDEGKGLIPRITQQIFASIAHADGNVEYTVKVSYMEIYMEKIRDLLSPANDNLSIHEDKTRGVYVKGLQEIYVGSEREVYAVMKAGSKARAISATNMNAESSRSHSIFVVGIHQRNVDTGSQKSGNLYLVDLAGSEKVSARGVGLKNERGEG